EALVFPVKDALMYLESTPLGVRGKGFQGESFYTAPNPKPAAVFTYYLKEDIKTIRDIRKETEKEKIKKNEDLRYPARDSIRLEDQQPAPHLLFTITDANGQVVNRIKAPAKKGLHRISWDFRYAPFGPVDFSSFDESFVFSSKEPGYMALPGNYTVSMGKFENGSYTDLNVSRPFVVTTLHTASLPAADKKELEAFSKKLANLRRVTSGVDAYRGELANKLRYFKQTLIETPAVKSELSQTIHDLEKRLNQVNIEMNGDASLARREFETLPSINGRVGGMIYGLWTTTSAPTQTYRNSYDTAVKQFGPVYREVKNIASEIAKLEQQLENSGAPYTPGRWPEWNGL
ncbi:MAG TPA: glycosyl hydrolase, partial [Saprospiraceae bacterium]|nr:glycosyl hydrolase [Saprospiraceae bacterium]